MENALNQPKQSEELCLAKHFVDRPFLSIQGDRNELTLQSPTTSAYGINLQEDRYLAHGGIPRKERKGTI